MQIKKSIIFNPGDSEEAEKLGVTVPDKAIVAFRLECWAVNPTVAIMNRPILPKAGRQLK